MPDNQCIQKIVLDTLSLPSSHYKQLVDQLAADIRAGRLRPGTRLPTHRELASREGLALATATRVYAELQVMGLVSGESGRGTFVKEALPRGHGIDLRAWNDDTTELTFNSPTLPGQAERYRTALRRLAAKGDPEALLRYRPHGGTDEERAIAAKHLTKRGFAATAPSSLLVSGAQHGLTIAAMALFEPGDVVAVDALTYPGFKLAAEFSRLELAPVPAAGDGMDLDALADLCQRRPVRAVYTMPTLHNPLGWVANAAWREALAGIVRRHGLMLIEDGAYAFLVEDAPPPLAAIAPEATVYVSSLSKSVATGLRVGSISAPAAWIPKLERAIRATTWNTPATMTAIVCGWIEDGTVAKLEAEKRRDAAQRQRVAAEVLGALNPVSHPASYFVWLPLAPEVRSDAIAMALMRERISVSTAHPFAVTSHVPHAIRLALGSVDMDELRRALGAVARVVADQTDR
jgi:DNA-binding transcriptional MocR family regulator